MKGLVDRTCLAITKNHYKFVVTKSQVYDYEADLKLSFVQLTPPYKRLNELSPKAFLSYLECR